MKMNPKQLEKMAKRMGIQTSPIEAEEVIIRTREKEIVISDPQVSKINMMGQETWQITGQAEEKPRKPFTNEDIDTVVNQTGATRGEVEAALEAAHGDLAEAIIQLKDKKE
jgi:nascent polypeptide-associated complex subunit alpha